MLKSYISLHPTDQPAIPNSHYSIPTQIRNGTWLCLGLIPCLQIYYCKSAAFLAFLPVPLPLWHIFFKSLKQKRILRPFYDCILFFQKHCLQKFRDIEFCSYLPMSRRMRGEVLMVGQLIAKWLQLHCSSSLLWGPKNTQHQQFSL